ncbi:hypothetical protein ACLMJK_002809 [Lecanora helva]
MHPDAIFEASLASKSCVLDHNFKIARDKSWDNAAVKRLLKLYCGHRKPLLGLQLGLGEALALSKLQEHIHFLATDFASAALSVDPNGKSLSRSESQASYSELGRIERTFYRFETYCNLFRQRERTWSKGFCNFRGLQPRLDASDRQETFFENFPPWENEQLACVREYLFNQVSIPFNDVAAHCVDWCKNEWDECYLNDDWEHPENSIKERLMSHGLGYIRRLVNCTTFDERCGLLEGPSAHDNEFLFAGFLAQSCGRELMNIESLARCSPNDMDKIFNRAPAADRDSGPREAWLWAHIDRSLDDLYNYRWEGHRFLRLRGYVMWDMVRWERWGLLNEEWERSPPKEWDPEYFTGSGTKYCYDEIHESFNIRHEISRRGGRGWWAPGDESGIQWPGGKVPRDWPPKKPAKPDMEELIRSAKQRDVFAKAREERARREAWPSDHQGWVDFFEGRQSSKS